MLKKVLWLSRHPMNIPQIKSLQNVLEADVSVTSKNVTFPTYSIEAVQLIKELAKGFDVVCGVFPAHIAAAVTWGAVGAPEQGCPQLYPLDGVHYYVPVSVPVPAEDGSVRAFQHSHWECITG